MEMMPAYNTVHKTKCKLYKHLQRFYFFVRHKFYEHSAGIVRERDIVGRRYTLSYHTMYHVLRYDRSVVS